MNLLRHSAPRWVLGFAALALATWICMALRLTSVTTACVYLAIIVLVSLTGNLIIAVIFPIIAVACLDYFFIAPVFAFDVTNVQDAATLAAFLIASIVVTSLVTRLQHLTKAQREQARLLDLTRDAVLVRNLDNVITYWNRGGEELYGWPKDEAVGKIAHVILRTTLPAPLKQITEEFLRSGYWEGDLVQTRRDGTQVIVSSRWSLQRGEDGEPVGILETHHDVTEKRRTQST